MHCNYRTAARVGVIVSLATVFLAIALMFGCSGGTRETAITSFRVSSDAQDAAMLNMSNIAKAQAKANALNRIRAKDDPAKVIEGVLFVRDDIEQERLNYVESNSVRNLPFIYMVSQRNGLGILTRNALEATKEFTTTQPTTRPAALE